MRISAILFGALVHVTCSAMMTVFSEKNDQYMPTDVIVEIAHQAPLTTKLNIRATSKKCENKIEILKLIEAKKALQGEKIYVLHIRDMIHYGKYKKIGNDQMGWKYVFSPDSHEEPLKENDEDPLKLKTLRCIRKDLEKEKNNQTIIAGERSKFRRAFSLGDKLDDNDGKSRLVLANFSNSDYDRKDKFCQSLLFPAIKNNNDKQFAKDLIKIDPYGFASNYYTVVDMQSISEKDLSSYDKARYTACCKKLPGYDNKYDAFLEKPRYNSCPMM